METLYRALTWINMGAAYLLVTLIFSQACLFIPDKFKWIFFIILPLIYIFMLYLGWKRRIKKDTVSEPVQISRLQSSLILFGSVSIIFALLKICIFHFGFNYFCGIKTPILLLALLLIGAFLTVIFKPFKKHANEISFVSNGIIAGIIINLIALAFAPNNDDYKGRNLPIFYEMPSAMQERFFPDGAYNFDIKSKNAFFATYAEWSCNVSEKDFEAFRKKHNYNFVLNRTDVNEDTDVGPLNVSDYGWQKPYYFYNNRHTNGGGLTMRYSVPEQKLYGRYSNR